MGETALITFRGERVPCLLLADVLGLPAPAMTQGTHTLALLRLASGDLFALAIERIHSHGDLVVKPLAPAVMKCGLYAGSALLDDGQPVLLLDVTRIAAEYHLVSDTRARTAPRKVESAGETAQSAGRVMLFTGLDGRRAAIRLELVQRIETISSSAIDNSGARPRAVIDGVILPLTGLGTEALSRPKLRLLRLSDGLTDLLYAVRDVEDATELPARLAPAGDDPLIEGLALIGGQPVAVLDAHALFARFGDAPQPVARPLCLLPDTDWARSILGPLVEAAGYRVAEDADNDTAGALTILTEEIYEVASHLGELPAGPIIRLRDQPDGAPDSPSIYRYDRDGLLKALRDVRDSAPLAHAAVSAGGTR
jgi:two-component system, chemotaxis family, sensor kinase CheA